MHIVRERTVNGVRTVFVAYGNETLSTGTGGYFALELQTAEASVLGILSFCRRFLVFPIDICHVQY